MTYSILIKVDRNLIRSLIHGANPTSTHSNGKRLCEIISEPAASCENIDPQQAKRPFCSQLILMEYFTSLSI